MGQRPAKQFVPQPHLVSANYVGLAVVCDLLDLALAEVPLHLAAVEPFGLSRQAHDLPPFPLPRISTSNCSGRDMSFSSVSAGVEWNVLGLPSIPRRFARRGFFLPSSVYRGAVRIGLALRPKRELLPGARTVSNQRRRFGKSSRFCCWRWPL